MPESTMPVTAGEVAVAHERLIPRRAVASWVLYDLANTIFSMGVVSLYFSLWVRDNVGAERAAYWTRQVLEDESNKAKRNRRWEVLGRLPIRMEAKGLLLVHASPRRPVNEYLFPEDVYTNPGKILDNFRRLEQNHMACLVGHTHVPGVFLDDPCFDPPDELGDMGFYTITADERAIINVGSIGQPRDRDPRLCYVVIYEKGEKPEGFDLPRLGEDEPYLVVEFIRLEYDIEKAARKIYDVPELDDFLGSRLFEGR